MKVLLSLVLVTVTASLLDAQPLFRNEAPLEVTFTTNLRDMLRQRDSTRLEWFGTEMRYVDEDGTERTIPVELRLRGHFRRQASNCSFPPLFVRTAREVRDGTIMQGNPRVKIVTPCRPGNREYQDYIFTEYQVYKAYEIIEPVHHRTRLARITYVDSSGRSDPLSVYAFFLETADEVGDEHGMENVETMRVLWSFMNRPAVDRLALFQYWVGNTDWSVANLHNIVLFQTQEWDYYPVAYDFDWTGAVNARYARPNDVIGLRSVRQRKHRGPCRTAEEWAPTIAYFKERRAALDAVWNNPLPEQDANRLQGTRRFLDDFWSVLDDPRLFRRHIIEDCQGDGN